MVAVVVVVIVFVIVVVVVVVVSLFLYIYIYMYIFVTTLLQSGSLADENDEKMPHVSTTEDGKLSHNTGPKGVMYDYRYQCFMG